jgi:lysine-specific demethylase 3
MYPGPGMAVSVKQPPAVSSPGPGLAITPSFQTQPLDLGVSSAAREDPSSPKRKAEEEAEDLDVKKVKVEPVEKEEPVLARVSEASPLLATAATTITTVLNTSVQQQERPQTPLGKVVNQDSEKSNSPGPARPSYPVHKLKKAWLQRHSGEDATENSSDVKGSGTCVTLPMPVVSTPPPVVKKSEPSVVNSLHSIGSMAVNSIKKPKGSRKGAKELNGHISTKTPQDGDDSSSSDPERKSTPQKRVPPKVKRKKGGGRKPVVEETKRKKTSVSSTESEKESGSDKDSDSAGTSNSTNSKKKEEKVKEGGKKRGRRPKSTPSKNGNEEESRIKKAKEEEPPAPQRDPIQKPSVGQLKKTGESFLQDGPCFEVAPKLAKCRECRWTQNQRNRNMPNIFCRFYAFRRLRYTKNGQLAIAGFSDPHRDALQVINMLDLLIDVFIMSSVRWCVNLIMFSFRRT